MAPEFEFHIPSSRYRYKDSKKFVSKMAVEALTVKAIEQGQEKVLAIADNLIANKITVGTWEAETKNELRKLHVLNYTLGAGGQHNLGNADYGAIGIKLRIEYIHLRGFAQDLIAGNVSQKQFYNRVHQYVDATNNTYKKGLDSAHIKGGFLWEKRVRTKEDSCAPCILMAQAGWRPIGFYPSAGEQCDCNANCGCYKEFSKAQYAPKESLLKKKRGFIGNG